jgi:thiopeptide-type bacteriocin biosynthesis protein
MSKPWISVHIFYSSNGNPLLAECVSPLVSKLRELRLISRYFFIRYWLGGPHVRLRLLPAEGVAADRVKEVVEDDLRAFLARRPALYEIDRQALAPLYRNMYEAEYGAEKFAALYGESGELPFFENNTFHYIDYEPEYDRYGGEAGVDLAERHFEVSSDLVLRLVRETNMHVRGIVMGHSVQMMLQMCYAFLGDEQRIVSFLERYMEFWQTSYAQNSQKLYPGFDRKYSHMAAKLCRRVEEVRLLNRGEDPSAGTESERMWLAHMKEVRAEALRLAAAQRLPLRSEVEDPEIALVVLLSGYIHMTNNRLGVSILDEIYLSYLIARALDGVGAGRLAEASGE